MLKACETVSCSWLKVRSLNVNQKVVRVHLIFLLWNFSALDKIYYVNLQHENREPTFAFFVELLLWKYKTNMF